MVRWVVSSSFDFVPVRMEIKLKYGFEFSGFLNKHYHDYETIRTSKYLLFTNRFLPEYKFVFCLNPTYVLKNDGAKETGRYKIIVHAIPSYASLENLFKKFSNVYVASKSKSFSSEQFNYVLDRVLSNMETHKEIKTTKDELRKISKMMKKGLTLENSLV
jgi:hypothetical protein